MVCVCLSVLFSHSHTVYATDEEISSEDIDISTLSLNDDDVVGGNLQVNYQILNTSWNHFNQTGFITVSNNLKNNYSCSITSSATTNFMDLIEFRSVDGVSLFDEGDSFNFSATNLINYLTITNLSTNVTTTHNFSDVSLISSVSIVFFDISNNQQSFEIDNFEFSTTSNGLNMSFSFDEVPFDVYFFSVVFRYDGCGVYHISASDFNTSKYNVVRYFGYNNSDFSFKTKDKTQGLLGNIIEWIKSIYEGIVNLPSKIASGLKAFFDNIVNAVTNIGNLIKNALVDLGNFLINGIKSLFIPSQEDITNMKTNWDTLLADRFGALYQVVDLIHDYASAFNSQSKGTITFPSVTIPLAGSEFTFGGWEVQVVPSGFDVLFNAIKLTTSVLATVFFVNGLKNRFEKLVGGSNDV